MLRKIIVFSFLLLGMNCLNAQVFFTEDFDSAPCALPGNSGCDPSIVGWTIVSLGGEGATANTWYVSDTESGVAPPGCGTSGLLDQSLHVGNVAGSTLSLTCPNGDCGAAYDAGSPAEITNKRVESPTISCVGQSNITVDFNYIEAGDGTLDDCSFWYFDGSSWTNLDPMNKTPLGCAPQGQWTAITTINLPASADNNPNVKIGYLWVNNGDGAGSDPSVAIDDITLTSNPVAGITAGFSATDSTICEGDCINFTDLSTGSPSGWTWYFPGSSTATSSTQNPTNICYSTAGSYDVSLVATDGVTPDSLYMPNFITVTALPNIATGADTSICTGDTANIYATGAISYTWDNGLGVGQNFTVTPVVNTTYHVTGTDVNGCINTDSIVISINPLPSIVASNDTTICVGDTVFLSATGAVTYNWDNGLGSGQNQTPTPGSNITYTVTGTDINSCVNTDQVIVTVNACGNPPVAGFSASDSSICIGDCINFNDLSTGAPTGWVWYFFGADSTSSGLQNPTNICYSSPGSFDVALVDTNSVGQDSLFVGGFITVNALPVVVANSTDTSICIGDSIVLSGSGASSYAWNNGVVDGISFSPAATTTYSVIGTDVNGCANSDSIQIVVNSCAIPPIANIGASGTSICISDCIDFTDLSSGGTPSAWSWYFFGASTNTSSVQNPSSICYDTAGTFDVALTVSNAFGQDSVYLANYITVDSCLAVPTELIIPTVFSPNRDGKNDLFKVSGGAFTTLHVEIYNRWGELLYISDQLNEGWNGRTTAGIECAEGTYFYVITADTEIYKGTLTLFR